jgi:putative transposase
VGVTSIGSRTTAKAYRYALDPTAEQHEALLSHFGASRFAYNHLLSLVLANWEEIRAKQEQGLVVAKDDYLNVGHFDLLRLWYATRDEVAPWWGENGASAYNDAAQRLSRALTNYFQGRARVPHYRRRGRGESVRFTGQAVALTDTHHVRISRVGVLKTYESTRKLNRHLARGTGRIVAATVLERSGKWFISFSVEITELRPTTRTPERIVGIDVGLSTLYTGATPSGDQVLRVTNPRHLVRAQSRLARGQHRASRRQGPRPGQASSKRWTKANERVQRIHRDVTNARRNFIHETTTMLAKHYDVIVVEDLNVKGMLKNHSLAKHIGDAAWGEFVRQLRYKTPWYGSTLVVVERFYPSTKTCSRCGTVKAKLSLDERMLHCGACGLVVDRDLNAAINLARMGLAGTNSVTGRGGEIRPGPFRPAHPDEASTDTPALVGA